MKVLLTGDWHVRDITPKSCTDAYLPDLFNLIRQVGVVARQRNVDCVCIAGDFFDNKSPSKNSHRLVQKCIELLKSYPCPVYIVPGNHDELNFQLESVFDTQPLGVIIRSGVAHLLSGWADSPAWKGQPYSWLDNPDTFLPIYGVPWLAEWNAEPEVANRAVEEALFDLHDRERFIHHEGEPLLIVTHSPLFPPGQESPYENYSTSDFARLVTEARGGNINTSIFYSHVHEYHGIYKVDGVTFANAGALSRGSLTESNVNRKICLTEWSY